MPLTLEIMAHPVKIPVLTKEDKSCLLRKFQKKYVDINTKNDTPRSVIAIPDCEIIVGLKEYNNRAKIPALIPYNFLAQMYTKYPRIKESIKTGILLKKTI